MNIKDNEWYKFKVSIDRLNPEQSDVWFPFSPVEFEDLGIKIHQYLTGCGFTKLDAEDENFSRAVIYLYEGDSPDLASSKLLSLYEKFKETGAVIIYKDVLKDYIPRAEFEALKKQQEKSEIELKKLEAKLKKLLD